MQLIKKYLSTCCCVWFCIQLSSCYVFKAYRSRKFLLKDLPKIEAQTVVKSNTPFYFATDVNNTRYHSLQTLLDTTLENSSTYSFLVIKNDTIIYEKYIDGLDSGDVFPSFSVSKSFVGTLIQMAHQEGNIKSLQEPITNYLPYLFKNDKRFGQITIQHLLDIRSGIRSNENYGNPFSDVIKLGFRRNIRAQLNRLKIAKPPGTFEYKSMNTQLLGMIVQQATSKKLYTYLQEKIWQPLGMEANATWNIDSRKQDNVKAFCCLNATTHDFAKLGRLYLNRGNWSGQQLLDSNWVNASTSPDSMYKYDGYRNQWWGVSGYKTFDDSTAGTEYIMQRGLSTKMNNYIDKVSNTKKYFINFPSGEYLARGILDQYVYVNREAKVIIVRTGHYWRNKEYSARQLIYRVGRQLVDY